MVDTRVEDEVAAGALTGAEILYCVQAGGPRNVTVDIINARGANPPTSDGRALGSGALQWSDAFWASGAVFNFGGGNYTVTHSSGLLAFSGAVYAGGQVRSAAVPNASTHFSAAGTAPVPIANGANYVLGASAVALILISDMTSFTGALYLISGGTSTLILTSHAGSWDAGTATPAAGKASIGWDGVGTYRIYNNRGSTISFVPLSIGVFN